MRPWLGFPLALVVGCVGQAPPPCPVAPPAPAPSAAPTAAAVPAAQEPPPDPERLRAYATTRGFRLGAPDGMMPTPDGEAVLFLRSGAHDSKQSLFETNLSNDETREILSPDALLRGPETLSAAEKARRERSRTRTTGFTRFELSEDGSRVLLGLSGRAFVYFLKTLEKVELATGGAGTDAGAVIDPRLSHDGKRVAYVRGHDLYAIDVGPKGSGHEVALTHGGTETLSHGTAEFIAAEELDRSRGFWWAPDDTRILYEEADTSKVEVLTIADPAHPEKQPDATRYPRAGTTNAKVRLGFIGSHGGTTTWVRLDEARAEYLATVVWQKGGPPTAYALDRAQRKGTLFALDPSSGNATTLLTETDGAWVDVDPTVPRWLPDGSGFLWSTEEAVPARRLELRNKEGGFVRTLSTPELGYRALIDVQEYDRQQAALIVASIEPTEASILRLPFENGRPPVDVIPAEAGNVSATVNPGHKTLAVRHSARASMPQFWAQSAVAGAPRHPIPDVTDKPSPMPQPEMVQVGPDKMRVAIVRPTGFVKGKRYPVLDSAYGGPGHSVATDSMLSYVLNQWLADSVGAVVVSIDARGTPNRGHDWERALVDKIGSVPLEGHVAALKALGEKLPELDTSRVGVYGWSFGGYFAAMAVLSRPDVYKVGVAAAPPADWRDYDTCYTERYLGMPGPNAAAYDAASLLTMATAPVHGAQGQLLIVHGTADDNVYFFHSLKLAGALEKAGKPFEMFPVPGMTHVPRDPENLEAVFRTAGDFLRAHL